MRGYEILGKQLTVLTNNMLSATVGGLFNDFDFNGLNKIIDNIGTSAKSLTNEEKISATEYVAKWNDSVVQKVHSKMKKLSKIKEVLDSNDYEYYLDNKDVLNVICSFKQSYAEGYHQLIDMDNELTDYAFNEPEKPLLDGTLSANDSVILKEKYQYDVAQFEAIYQKKKRKVKLHFRELKNQIMRDKQIIEMLDTCKKQRETLKDLSSQFDEKAALAKMNIVISSDEVRAALQDMNKFVKEKLS